jgi:hypothetical protein
MVLVSEKKGWSRMSGRQREPEQRIEAIGKNPAAVALGMLGGLKGGPARAKKLSKERRSEIARKAAEARWKAKE